MKKFLKIAGVSLVLLLGIAFALPFVFKDEIKRAVENEIRKRVDADVKFGDLHVTLFRNFPNLTVGLDGFSVVNHEPFKGDTLASMQRFNLVVDIMSVLFGEKYELRKVAMETPRIHAKVLRNGKANWDIMRSDSAISEADTVVADSGRASFNIALRQYSISDGYLMYDDKAGDMFFEVGGLNHKGKGDFTEKIFEFYTTTDAVTATVMTGGTTWLKKGKLNLDVNVKVDQDAQMYTLMKNSFALNELVLNLDGWVKLSGDDIVTDLKFSTSQTNFRNLLSMVPGMYTESFKNVNTNGEFKLSGAVKGRYNDKSMPALNVSVELKNGYFQYPDLPQAVSNINGTINVESPEGNMDAMKVNIPKFHADFGNNPIDAKVILSGLTSENMNIDADVKAKMNLEELGQMYPMQGQVLKGKFMVDAKAAGVWNSVKGTFPKVDAKMSLENGYVKSADFPSAIENLSFSGTMSNVNGSLAETVLDIPKFHAEIDKEPVDASFAVKNFDNPDYKASVKGSLDLEKLNRIYPIEGATMAGKIVADIRTSGIYSDVEAGRYMNLPTSGTVSVNGLKYADGDIPQGITIDAGRVNFTPQQMVIEQYSGKLGSSPVSITGTLENYLAYVMMDNQEIRGRMNLVSAKFDVNEWMSDEETPATGTPAEAPADAEMYVFEVPKGIDFTFDAVINKVLYDNMVIDNLKGRVIMRNQEVRFENLAFNTLGGKFAMNGSYNTRDITKPTYNLDFDLQGLQAKPTWETFVTVQKLVPAGKFVTGIFNSTFNLSGTLTPDMMPDLTNITGKGNLALLAAGISNFKVLDAIADKTKLDQFKKLVLNDTKLLFDISDGKFKVNPFDVKVGNTVMNVSGSNGFDKSMDYKLKFDIPAGAAGTSAANALSSLTGRKISGAEKINVDLNLGGTVDDPKITGAGSSVTQNLKDEAKQVVDEKKEELKQQAEEKVEELKDQAKQKADEAVQKAKEEAERLKNEAEAKARAEQERLKKEAEAKAKAEQERLKKQAEDAKKKAEDEAKKKLKGLKFP